MTQGVDARSFEAVLRDALPGQLRGLPLFFYDSIDSTNSQAKRLLASGDLAAPAVVVATQQEAGRGRQGRMFNSPPGGLYMSYVIPHDAVADPELLTPAVAVATRRAIMNLAPRLDPGIKWVNDIFLGDRKLAGILCETSGDTAPFVIGIGVNVTVKQALIPQTATSLSSHTLRPPQPGMLCAAIIANLDAIMRDFDPSALIDEYKQASTLLGREVECDWDSTEPYTATAIDIDERARLFLRLHDGSIRILHSGDVRVRSL
ncbi:MAG: biotin--[Coriobacteriales bacterium]|nr:biotin--[acetyl-CoA-carboxylase] ligase [Coriobacteriales bacterium]